MEQKTSVSREIPVESTESFSQNPYFFIVGCARSGTTLLKRMVDAHPRIVIPRESHWIPRYFKRRTGLTPEGLVTPELIPKLFEYHRFPHLEASREDLERLMGSDEPVSYSSFVTGIFDLYGRRKGKPLVGDKTPGYVRNIPLLHALWPRARFVHLIRDGRDVALSMSKWRMVDRALSRFASREEDRVSTTALWWEWSIRLGREGGSALGPDLYHEVRYEELVSRPRDAIEALCAVLGVPPDNAMLEFHEGRTQAEPGLSTNRSWLPPTPGIRDWRTQMPAADVERFEALAGDLLDELGYERTVLRLPPRVLERASRLRDSFTRDLRT